MIIISLTTIPKRLENLHFTINSLLDQILQPDKIIINIPIKYENYNEEFTIPSYLLDHNKIIINRGKDYGPATKLLGLKDNFMIDKIDNNDLIIIIDDDRNYEKDFILKIFEDHKKYPDYVLTNAGWEIETLTNNQISYIKKNHPRGIEYSSYGFIDILGGCCGFSFLKKLYPLNKDFFELTKTDDKFYVDDIWISGFFTLNGINIFLIPGYDATRNINNNINSLSESKSYNNNDRFMCNYNCIQYFREKYNIWK
jgi:hypothetical protein